MGVYIFQTVEPWIKVGHHECTRARPNAYYRIAGRGFQACVHPPELEGRLWVQDLTLVAWYPRLTMEHERLVHREFSKGKIGEFHLQSDLAAILDRCDSFGPRAVVTSKQRHRALEWGWRRVRRAKHHAKKR